MALGGMLGGLADSLGGIDGIIEKLNDAGIDASVIEGLDLEAIVGMIEEKGIDLSILETLGVSVEDIIEKVKGA
ncbi:hypothetical protein JANAI62_02480 [Jannaschia pagri]|uniref:DUF937 domain-containing protein n=1 Tax=Jannaschia pagri TaxID=2829797 RepID=A0ABQ4NGS6_9RHOB|nr:MULTISPECIES: hypothetical protein [unclassified Jannaschia]GIT90269.1 hypothetical protein JANAI61_07270 [Jannaschia sp. AI_61]GIT93625.1 hypothetical protein JANAI62_02480 [Jannaschia sp. AI_62]